VSIAEVQARMAAITAQFVTPLQAPATQQAVTTTSTKDFATALASESAQYTSSPATAGSTTGSTTGSTATGTAAELIADAKRYLGVPYVWGGTNPATGLDCSGLTQLVYGQVGVDLPRVSWQQAKVGTAVDGLANAKPGDLLAFGSPVDHVAIYLGDHKMIHAPHPGKDVEISDVYEAPSAIRRVLPDEPAAAGPSALAQTLSAYPNLANLQNSALGSSVLQNLGGTLS
jgi:cell wall-associated NlpC family hydrolase